MVGLGYVGWQRTTSQEDYATARGSYGWIILGFAFVANLASGVTFLGHPGLAYEFGFKALLLTLGYPIGAYSGVLLAGRLTKKIGDQFESQSVPDLLGDRYDSTSIRIVSTFIGFALLTYVMAQMAAAGHMFDLIFGVDYTTGVLITTVFLIAYVVIGGSHADILTDGIQGAIMLFIVAIVAGATLVGLGLDGSISAINRSLEPSMRWNVPTQESVPLFANWWIIILGVFIGHLGFVTQPHIGNKFFALRNDGQMKRFLLFTSIAAILTSLISLGGVLGRANGIAVENADAIIPALFIEFFPPIIAAFLGVAILSAIISTSDGVVVAISQLVANDLYRKSYVPWKDKDPQADEIDTKALWISRIVTLVTIIVSAVVVLTPPDLLSVFVMIGIGGIMAAYSGPYFVGLYWEKATEKAALIAMIVSFIIFQILYVIPNIGLYDGNAWPAISGNPFATAGIGFIVSVTLTIVVSFFTSPPSDDHIDHVFRTDESMADGGVPETDTESDGNT